MADIYSTVMFVKTAMQFFFALQKVFVMNNINRQCTKIGVLAVFLF